MCVALYYIFFFLIIFFWHCVCISCEYASYINHLAICTLLIFCAVRYPGSQIYYIGIVDGSFNMGRPRPDQASLCYYRLRVWSGQCVYWDDVVDQWSAAGCYLHESSTFHLAQCRYIRHSSLLVLRTLSILFVLQCFDIVADRKGIRLVKSWVFVDADQCFFAIDESENFR